MRFKPNSKETAEKDYASFVGESLLLAQFQDPDLALKFKMIIDEAMRKAGKEPNYLEHSPIMKACELKDKGKNWKKEY